MTENIKQANAARIEAIDAVSDDIRRLTAASRSGQSFTDGEQLAMVADLLPAVAAIDGGTQYLAYDAADNRQLSFKTLFGKKVVAPVSDEVEATDTPYTVTVNNEAVPIVLVDREHFGPRTTGSLQTEMRSLKDGTLIPVFTAPQALTVHVQDMYVVRRPDGVDRHPAGQYYCYLAQNYATFSA